MALYQNDDLEYIGNDYFDMGEFEDDNYELSLDSPREQGSAHRPDCSSHDDDDNDDDDDEADCYDSDLVRLRSSANKTATSSNSALYCHQDSSKLFLHLVGRQSKQKTDTSAAEARNGKDIQGIPWERMNYTRDKYRETRLKQYKNYVSLSYSQADLERECKKVEKGSSFFHFQFNTRLVKSTIVHFQLRNLVWATSKHDVYLMHNYSVMHWSSLFRRAKEVLNVAGHVAPVSKLHASRVQPLSRVQVSTMSVKDNLIVAGGFQGELICKRLNTAGVEFCSKIATDENGITNAVDIYRNANGSIGLMTANNDCHVRVFDTESFTMLSQFSFPWSVNNTSVSHDGKLLVVLGDSSDCMLADAQSGKLLGELKGHLDYTFSSAWHPDGNVVATGNQDMTCRLWDVRNLSQSLAVLKGRMGAIRAIKFTQDGKYMAMAEAADFVHVFDARGDYIKSQEIDLFGEIAGISFSPDDEALFVGVADRTYGSLLEFTRRHRYQYLDALM